jgi:hypothetical protein
MLLSSFLLLTGSTEPLVQLANHFAIRFIKEHALS